MKIQDIPENDRPYEKCLQNGPENLSDQELLSIIIRSGTTKINSMEIAGQILALNYPDEGILGLLRFSLADLRSVPGIGTVKAIQLMCIGELSRRIWKSKQRQNSLSMTDPSAVARYLREDLRYLGQEQIRLMLFNTKQVLIHEVLLSQGTVNAALVSPREIFIEALRYQAVNIILVHNHPSGDATPSREDLALTRSVKEAGEIIGIRLIDHIIIGDKTYVSLREQGVIWRRDTE